MKFGATSRQYGSVRVEPSGVDALNKPAIGSKRFCLVDV